MCKFPVRAVLWWYLNSPRRRAGCSAISISWLSCCHTELLQRAEVGVVMLSENQHGVKLLLRSMLGVLTQKWDQCGCCERWYWLGPCLTICLGLFPFNSVVCLFKLVRVSYAVVTWGEHCLLLAAPEAYQRCIVSLRRSSSAELRGKQSFLP